MRFLRLIGLLILAVLALASPGFAAAQTDSAPAITAPTAGQVVQGQVAITGTTDIPNFQSAELAFAYASDPTGTWFPIREMTDPVSGGVLATWDTTAISDGNYVLRLRVSLTYNSSQEVSVPVEVRNYTLLPTASPTVTATQLALQVPTPILVAPSETPTPLPLPTPTLLSPNSVEVTTGEVYAGFWRGALGALVLLLIGGIIIRLRRNW